MSWKAARPAAGQRDIEDTRREQESYDRAAPFGVFQWTPPPVAGNSTVAFVLSSTGPDIVSTVATGARVAGTSVTLTPPSVLPNQMSFYGFCAANDSVTIVLVNPAVGAQTAPAGTWALQAMVVV